MFNNAGSNDACVHISFASTQLCYITIIMHMYIDDMNTQLWIKWWLIEVHRYCIHISLFSYDKVKRPVNESIILNLGHFLKTNLKILIWRAVSEENVNNLIIKIRDVIRPRDAPFLTYFFAKNFQTIFGKMESDNCSRPTLSLGTRICLKLFTLNYDN